MKGEQGVEGTISPSASWRACDTQCAAAEQPHIAIKSCLFTVCFMPQEAHDPAAIRTAGDTTGLWRQDYKVTAPSLADTTRACGTHWSTLLAIEAMMKRTASVTSQGGFPSFKVAYSCGEEGLCHTEHEPNPAATGRLAGVQWPVCSSVKPRVQQTPGPGSTLAPIFL